MSSVMNIDADQSARSMAGRAPLIYALLDRRISPFSWTVPRIKLSYRKRPDEDWDPWPVKRFRPDATYRQARRLVRQKSESSVDAFLDHMELLPAYTLADNILRFTKLPLTKLYSIRSPGRPPTKIHIWTARNGIVMVRHKLEPMSLSDFLDVFENTGSSFGTSLDIWKQLHEEDIHYFPPKLRQDALMRWRALNTFPKLMDLPAELYEKIIQFAVAPHKFAEPYDEYACRRMSCGITNPNMNVALVSRLFYDITAHIVYTQITFRFHDLEQYVKFMDSRPSGHRKNIRSIEISFRRSDALAFFGVDDSCHLPPIGQPRLADQGRSRIEDLTGLQRLCINIPHRNSRHTSNGACEEVVCDWVWAAARPHLNRIPHLQFKSPFKQEKIDSILETLKEDRVRINKGLAIEPLDMVKWQEGIWSVKYASLYITSSPITPSRNLYSYHFKHIPHQRRTISLTRVQGLIACGEWTISGSGHRDSTALLARTPRANREKSKEYYLPTSMPRSVGSLFKEAI